MRKHPSTQPIQQTSIRSRVFYKHHYREVEKKKRWWAMAVWDRFNDRAVNANPALYQTHLQYDFRFTSGSPTLYIYIYSFEAWYNDTFVELLTFIASRSIFYMYILFIYRETKCIPNVCHRYHYFLLLLLSLLSSHFSSFISLHSLSRSISCFSLQRIFFTVFVGRNRYTRNQSGLCRWDVDSLVTRFPNKTRC